QKVGWHLGVPRARVRAVPAAVRLGSLDLLEPVLRHAPLRDKPRDVGYVDLAPDALGSPRRVPLQEALVIEALADAIYPAPTEDDVDSLFRRDRRKAGPDLVDLDPDLVCLVVVATQPLVEGVRVHELSDLMRIYLTLGHAGHGATPACPCLAVSQHEVRVIGSVWEERLVHGVPWVTLKGRGVHDPRAIGNGDEEVLARIHVTDVHVLPTCKAVSVYPLTGIFLVMHT